MKRFVQRPIQTLLISSMLLLSLSACNQTHFGAGADGFQGMNQTDFGGIQNEQAVPGEYIIKRRGVAYITPPAEFAQQNGLLYVREIEALSAELYLVSDPAILSQLGDQLEYSEPNYLQHISADQSTIQRLAQVKAQSATANLNNFIGIIDTGVDMNSAALQGRVLPGHNTLGNEVLNDDHGHGTQMATMAVSDNASMSGLSPGGQVLPVKALDKNGIGTDFSVAAGIIKAIEYGAQVVVVSTTSMGQGQLMSQAMSYASQNNVSIVGPGGMQSARAMNAPRTPYGQPQQPYYGQPQAPAPYGYGTYARQSVPQTGYAPQPYPQQPYPYSAQRRPY